MRKELFWKHGGTGATAQGAMYSYRVFESAGTCGWVADKDGQPWEGYGVSDIVAAKRAAEEFAEKNDDFPKMAVTRNDGRRIVAEVNSQPGNPMTRVEVELSIHHTGVVTVELDANSADIDVDVEDYTAMIIREGIVAEDVSIRTMVGKLARHLRNTTFSEETVETIPTAELAEFERLLGRLDAISQGL